MGQVQISEVWKQFGQVPAVSDLSLEIEDGDFMVFLGPSGCGKTTSLRMLAGLEHPSAGEIRIDGKLMNGVAPGRRDVAMVFQSYALYPHMDVYKNLAFGPRVRRENKAKTDRLVREVAETLGLSPLLKRKPAALSGGQRQRVALGRALMRQPTLFLMDEPLSNLDAALRTEVRAELNRLHKQLGITTAYVTHDQTEAMSMGDKIAVMSEGRLCQSGTPQDVYDNPGTQRVATFLGSPRMNIVTGRLAEREGEVVVDVLGARIALATGASLRRGNGGREVVIGFRPSDVLVVSPESTGDELIHGRVEITEPMGAETWVTVLRDDVSVIARAPGRARIEAGDRVCLQVDPRYLYVFDAERGDALIDRSGLAKTSRPIVVEATG